MNAIESDLKFNGYKVKEVEYKQYDIDPNEIINYTISMKPELKIQDRSSILLTLNLGISGKQQEKIVTEISIIIEGTFSTNKFEENEFKKLVSLNGTATLITIARSFIASFSSQIGNTPPIVMPLINVQASIEDDVNLENKDYP